MINIYVYCILYALPVSYNGSGMEVSFDMCKGLKKVQAVELWLYKRSVSLGNFSYSFSQQTNCTSSNNSIQMTMFAGTGNSQHVTTKTLAGNDLLSKRWIGFHGLSKLTCSVQHNFTSEFKVRIVARNNCSKRLVDPRELGLFVEEEETALLVVYSETSNEVIQARQDTARQRRQIRSEEHSPNPVIFDNNQPCSRVDVKVSDFVVCQYSHWRIIFILFIFVPSSLQFSLSHIMPDLQTGFALLSSEEYWGNACYGQCLHPLENETPSNFHSAMQAKISLHESIPPPCCVPTAFSPLPVLLLLEGVDIYHCMLFHNATATRCGCF